MKKNVSSMLELSENEPLWRRRGAVRIWALAGGTLVGLAVLVWAAPWCYRFIKTKTAEEVTFESFPSSQQVTLSPGNACIVRLPNRRTVALWCSKPQGIVAALDESDLTFEYGEAPFKSLKRDEVALPGGGVTSGEYLSYIRQGPVITSGNKREYILYVDKYCLNISSEAEGQAGDTLPLKVSARMATEKELIPRKREREHYLHALHSNEPKTRREAIHELGLMVAMGSTYAGSPFEIAEAIRPFLKDSDEAVGNEAIVMLRVMGDDDALLEMLTPRPIPEFIERNGAWTIAGWCRKDSERVPKHVMTYFETDDPKLHEFAIAFFSCYDGVRTQAAVSLGRIGDAKAYDRLLGLLNDDGADVRESAVNGLRWMGQRDAIKAITELADGDSNENVRQMAKRTVRELREK